MKNSSYLYLLLFGFTFLTASCDEEETETFTLESQEPEVAITGVSPMQGYVGDEFAISGENFEGAVEFVKVFIGEDETRVLSCTDTHVTAEVPQGATTGKISMTFFGEEIKTDSLFVVLGQPSVLNMSQNWGFIGSEITFTGENLGTKKQDIKMRFGDSQVNASVTAWSEESFTVTVPEDATSGKITLNISTQKVNVPEADFILREHATLTEVAPEQAYKGAELTLKGTNLGATTEGLKVWVDGQEAEVISCDTENEIRIKVPVKDEIAEGEPVSIEVETKYEKVEGKLEFTVIKTPTIEASGISPTEGYIGSIISITGSDMPETEENIKVMFEDREAEITGYEEKTIKAKVPNGLNAGVVKLSVTIAGLPVYEGNFTVNETPAVTSFDKSLVLAGETLTINGSNFGTFAENVSVFFDETEGEITKCEGNQIIVTVPASLGTKANVKVTLKFGDIPTVEAPTAINVMGTSAGDVTDVVLKNCKAPFSYTEQNTLENATWWYKPEGWKLSDIEHFYPLIINADYPNGCISFLNNKWDALTKVYTSLDNAKMYQVVQLPTGKYKFTLTIPESTTAGTPSAFEVIFAATKGNATLPDLQGSGQNWTPSNSDNMIDYVSISNISKQFDKENHTTETGTLEIELNETTEVTIGFVAQIKQGNGGANSNVSEIKVERLATN